MFLTPTCCKNKALNLQLDSPSHAQNQDGVSEKEGFNGKKLNQFDF